jgi:hypothetical protein
MGEKLVPVSGASTNETSTNANAYIPLVAEYTFFVDADSYGLGGFDAAALAADESDLFDAGVESVDIPTAFGADLGDRIPVRVVGSPKGLRFYARLLGVKDPLQLEELDRVVAAAVARGE